MPCQHTAADFGWFTPPDLEILYLAVSRLPDPQSIILVGGQSLSFWVDYFNIDVPQETGAYLTQDVDFLGSKQEAKLLAQDLRAEIRIAGLDDNTVNTAVLTYPGQQGKLLYIDFLSAIIGIQTSAEIKKRAVPFEWDGKQVHILHPLLCLKSRIANLHILPGKRNGNGISQAHYAIEVVKRYINNTLEELSERDAIDLVKEVREISLSDASMFVYHEFGVDVLKAVDIERFTLEAFLQKDWPNVVRWATKHREIYCRKASRHQLDNS